MKKFYLCLILLACLNNNIFAQAISSLRCETMGTPNGTQTQFNQIGYSINGLPIEYSGCQLVPAIMVAVIDSFCKPWNNCDHSFGQQNYFTLTGGFCDNNPSGNGTCRNRPENYFIFHFNNIVQMDSLNSMLNAIPNDNYILAYTWYTDMYSNIPMFKTAFQNLGATQIISMPDTVPYIFFMKKGNISSVQELVGVNSSDSLILNTTISCNTTAVSEIESNYFSIFPNPVTDRLYFSNVGEKISWEIFSATGQMVLSGKLISDDSFIDLKNSASGFYSIRIKDDERIINRRFVKVHCLEK